MTILKVWHHPYDKSKALIIYAMCSCNRYIVSARSMTLPEYIDLLKPEYGMYKLPFVPLPFWVCLSIDHPV